MKSVIILLMTTLVVLTINISLAKAWGIAYENNKITLNEGQIYLFYTSLQNMENTAKTVTISLQGDTDIAAIEGATTYNVAPMTKGSPVYIRIAIPKPAKDRYSLTARYVATPVGNTGISLSLEKTVSVEITVKKQPLPITETGSSGFGGVTHNPSIPLQNKTIMAVEPAQAGTETQTETQETQPEDEANITMELGEGITPQPKQAGMESTTTWIYLPIIICVFGIGGYIIWKKDLIGEFEWL